MPNQTRPIGARAQSNQRVLVDQFGQDPLDLIRAAKLFQFGTLDDVSVAVSYRAPDIASTPFHFAKMGMVRSW